MHPILNRLQSIGCNRINKYKATKSKKVRKMLFSAFNINKSLPGYHNTCLVESWLTVEVGGGGQ